MLLLILKKCRLFTLFLLCPKFLGFLHAILKTNSTNSSNVSVLTSLMLYFVSFCVQRGNVSFPTYRSIQFLDQLQICSTRKFQ